MEKKYLFLGLISLLFFAGLGCGSDPSNAEQTTIDNESVQYDLALQERIGEQFEALPAVPAQGLEDPEVKLGYFLYHDKRLSKTGKVSCNSCHELKNFGVDHLSFSPGDAGENGGRNSPTVLNAALHRVQFWDGRAKDVEEQAGMPILNPIEMAIPSKEFLVQRLQKISLYPPLFQAAFPQDKNPVSYANLQKAIGKFERTLLTPSRYDKYLQGDKTALTVQEKKGFLNFITLGCATCHAGALLGGSNFQKFGVYQEYWTATGSQKIDEGVYAISKDTAQKYFFKVPSLRNVGETYPYFHDGSIKDLGSAVEIMAKVQLNITLSKSEKTEIVAFLNSLTGEIPAKVQNPPAEFAVMQ